jgi:hypothetical protein
VSRTILMFLALRVLAQGWPSNYHPYYVWDRMGGQGSLWLSWTPERRLGFAEGFLWAYQEGFDNACQAYFNATPPDTTTAKFEDSALHKCFVRRPNYTKDPDYYAAQITAYYERYPEDVDLPIRWLFLAFSDQEHKTPEEIHRHWAKHEHP